MMSTSRRSTGNTNSGREFGNTGLDRSDFSVFQDGNDPFQRSSNSFQDGSGTFNGGFDSFRGGTNSFQSGSGFSQDGFDSFQGPGTIPTTNSFTNTGSNTLEHRTFPRNGDWVQDTGASFVTDQRQDFQTDPFVQTMPDSMLLKKERPTRLPIASNVTTHNTSVTEMGGLGK